MNCWLRSSCLCLLGSLFVNLLPAEPDKPDSAGVEFFEKKIRPVLVSRCYPCHSASAPKLQGGFQLDSKSAMRRGGNSGPPIVPGDPESSLLIKALHYSDDTIKMPPGGKPLKPEIVADFEEWIRMGAPDPRADQPKSANPAWAKAQNWWAFQKPVRPAVPPVADQKWIRTPIDNFILAKLQESKLTPSAATDRRTLLRRATYDLTGLPPTAEQIEAFTKDKSPKAFEKVVDRLLASPQYGERWGRHWMDVARYADTSDGPERFPFSYTYRDWVIRAFNEDMPYNDFVRKQLAADKINGSDQRDLAALGYITLGRSVPKGEHDMIDDRIDAIARGFLGMTVACARCHDHKFDPIPTKDYYSFYGIIANSTEPTEYPFITGKDPDPALTAWYRQGLERRLHRIEEFKTKRHAELVAEYRQPAWLSRYLIAAQQSAKYSNNELEALARDKDFNLYVLRRWRDYLNLTRENSDSVFAPWNAFVLSKPVRANSNPEVVSAMASRPPASIEDLANIYAALFAKFDSVQTNPVPSAEAIRLALRGEGTPTNIPLSDFMKIRGAGGDDNIIRGLENDVRVWQAQLSYRGLTPAAMAVQDSLSLTKAHVFVRGNPNNLGVETPPHFLTVLSQGGQPQTFTNGSGRLDLANAIVDPQNPVTARVIVNRVWTWHFGRGIVNSPSDFGTRGDLPSHPELLDYLATRFMQEGWSIKKLQRWIMLSNTYQQASADRPEARQIDPENKLLWRANRQRLDYESLRDSTLQVAGQLDLKRSSMPFSLTAEPTVTRRSVYAYLQRGRLPGELTAFDFASPESHVPQRFQTTVPQQALFLMNSPFVMEEAQHLAGRREVDSARNARVRIQALYRIVYGRLPSSEETALGLDYVQQALAQETNAKAPVAVWQYGIGTAGTKDAHLEFTPLRYFVDAKWQPGSITPVPIFGDAELTAKGGTPPDHPEFSIVRRWIAPAEGTLDIAGSIIHKLEKHSDDWCVEVSDGIHARIVRNATETLAEQTVLDKSVPLMLKKLPVHTGETIDFAVDCIGNPESDTFTWTPVLTLTNPGQQPRIWNAAKDFHGPAPLTLNAWEKYAQVLLQSNEFAFVD